MDIDAIIDMLMAAGVPGTILAMLAWFAKTIIPQLANAGNESKEAKQRQLEAIKALTDALNGISAALKCLRDRGDDHEDQA